MSKPAEKGIQDGREKLMIGYSLMRNDDPRGQFYNWRTMRAMVVNGDGTGTREVGGALADEPNAWTQFAGWSPDGKLAIVSRVWESEENFKWERANRTFRMGEGQWLLDSTLVDLATGKIENVSAVDRVSPYNSNLFFWPGDKNRLGFQAMIGDKSHPYSMDRDGKNKRDLTDGKSEFTYGFSASPDGKRITYHKNYQVYIANADGSDAKKIDTGHPFHFNPLWSPDGKLLLFLDGEHYDCHPTLVSADGTGLRRIATRGGYRGVTELLVHPDFHSESSDTPVWGADGKWIYYVAKVDDAMELMRVSIAGDVQRLTHSKPGVTHFHPRTSDDAQWLLFGSDRDGKRQMYVARADGSAPAPITDLKPGYSANHGHWRPR